MESCCKKEAGSGRKELGRLFGWCNLLIRQRMNERLQDYDLTPVQAQVILYLTRQNERQRVNQRTLGEVLRVKPSTVNGIVERLEERGFLERHPGVQDARCRMISVTEKGRALEKALSDGIVETEQKILKGFTEEEGELLRSYLLRILENLSEKEEQA